MQAQPDIARVFHLLFSIAVYGSGEGDGRTWHRAGAGELPKFPLSLHLALGSTLLKFIRRMHVHGIAEPRLLGNHPKPAIDNHFKTGQ
jgi:hypothetical protein